MEKALPAIPAKRYFTIGEVSELCGVKPYVLRYWEQEFTQLKPMKRRGNRRYYQHHEVLLVRRIRELLYDQGFTISGARNRLSDALAASRAVAAAVVGAVDFGALDSQVDDEALDGEPEALPGGAIDAGASSATAPRTATGAANRVTKGATKRATNGPANDVASGSTSAVKSGAEHGVFRDAGPALAAAVVPLELQHLRAELLSIRDLLIA